MSRHILPMQVQGVSMPIKIPDQLPAAEVLGQENIFVMTESRAVTQNIRPAAGARSST